jgi:alkylation response protein AidB-like acyl-CoA dehydrogenase
LIPGTLLKRALKGKLGLMQFFGQVEQELASGKLPKYDGLLAHERRLTELAKRQLALVLGAAAMKFQASLEKQQEVLSDLADLAIDVYGMDSVVTRARQAAAKLGEEKAKLHIACARLFTVEAAERVAAEARHVAGATLEGAELEALVAKVAKLDPATIPNLPALREAVTAQVVERNGLVLPS